MNIILRAFSRRDFGESNQFVGSSDPFDKKAKKHLTIDHIHIMLNWWNLVLNKIVSKRKLLKSHISSTELPFYVAFHFASGYFLSLSSSMSSVFRVVGYIYRGGFQIWAVFDVGRKKVLICVTGYTWVPIDDEIFWATGVDSGAVCWGGAGFLLTVL